MTPVRLPRLLAFLIAIALAATGLAHGADIRGVVRYSGPMPERARLPVTIDQYICGKEKDAEDLILGPDRGVLNAVVWLENPPAGAKWPTPLPKVEMDQKGCVFTPRLVVVPAGGTVHFLNSDRLLHNLHSQGKENASFNRTQPHGRTVPITFARPEIVSITCDLHSWMRSWVVVAEHPFYSATGPGGEFAIAGVPPGKYRLRLWQEALGNATREVVVDAQGATVTFDIKARR
jgi:plastocyanin